MVEKSNVQFYEHLINGYKKNLLDNINNILNDINNDNYHLAQIKACSIPNQISDILECRARKEIYEIYHNA